MILFPRSLFLAALCSTPGLLRAQPAIEWQRCLGGTGWEGDGRALATPDGGSILVASTNSTNGHVVGNPGGWAGWVVKLDAQGGITWQRALGGTGVDRAHAVALIPGGGYCVVGDTDSNDGDVSGNHGGQDLWVVKLDANGEVYWQRCMGGTGVESAKAVSATSDGGFIVAGHTNSTDGDSPGTNGEWDGWAIKLDADGQTEWSHTFGGSGYDLFLSVQQTTDGGYILGGDVTSADAGIEEYAGEGDMWLLKLDPAGAMEWQRAFGGDGYDYSMAVIQNSAGGYLLFGSTEYEHPETGNYEEDMRLVMTDADGATIWERVIGGSDMDLGEALVQLASGNYLLAGSSRSADGDMTINNGVDDLWLAEIDAQGMVLWQHSWGGENFDGPRSVHTTADGGYLVAGATSSNNGDVSGYNGGIRDVWVVKFEAPTGTGVALSPEPSFTACPNPVHDVLTLHFAEQARPTHLRVIDASGRKVLEQAAASHSGAVTLHLGALQPGTYLVEVMHADGARATQRIVKQ